MRELELAQETHQERRIAVNVLLQPEDHARLKQAAEDACRSLHGECLYRLKRSLSEETE
jgi:hypothetical protein